MRDMWRDMRVALTVVIACLYFDRKINALRLFFVDTQYRPWQRWRQTTNNYKLCGGLFVHQSRFIHCVISALIWCVSASSYGAEPSKLEREYQARFDAMMADLANPERSFEFVQIAVKTGDLRGAIAALERILKIQPDLSNIKLELGLQYHNQLHSMGTEFLRFVDPL